MLTVPLSQESKTVSVHETVHAKVGGVEGGPAGGMAARALEIDMTA